MISWGQADGMELKEFSLFTRREPSPFHLH